MTTNYQCGFQVRFRDWMSNQFLEGICSLKDVLPCQLLLARKRGGLTLISLTLCLKRAVT